MGFIKTYVELLVEYWPYVFVGGLVVVAMIVFLAVRYDLHNPYRLYDMWKPNRGGSLPSKVFCEDRHIRDRRFSIGRYVLSDHANMRSVYLVHSLLMAKPRSSKKFLAVSERSDWPIDFLGKVPASERDKYPEDWLVFGHATADINAQIAKNSASHFVMTGLTIMALCGALTVCIVAILAVSGVGG